MNEKTSLWQPHLEGNLIRLRPLKPADFDALYAVASDPLIWELHPERERYQRPVFSRFFQSGIESGGALAVLDSPSGRMIGTSRFTGYEPANSLIEVGYTFLAREFWGKGHNSELKALMLAHAFKVVTKVQFYIGEKNFRSRRAIEKLGATFLRLEPGRSPIQGNAYTSAVYEISRTDWQTKLAGKTT